MAVQFSVPSTQRPIAAVPRFICIKLSFHIVVPSTARCSAHTSGQLARSWFNATSHIEQSLRRLQIPGVLSLYDRGGSCVSLRQKGFFWSSLSQMEQGVKVYDRADTFGEWVMQCIESAANLGRTTYETYRQHARLYVLSQPIANIRVADLWPADLRAWVAGITKVKSERTKKRLSGNTIRHAYDRIRVAILTAFDDKRIDWLPPQTLKLPRIEETERRALTLDECNKLIEFATNLRLAIMFKTFIATGMREGELIGLLWDMIDWQRKEINLTSQLKWLREEKHWERVELKSRKRRRIPLNDDFLIELRAHRVRQMEERLRRGDEWQENGLVFPTSVGTPFHPRNLIDDLQRDAKKAGIGKVTVHELRHTAGSLMLQAGKTMTTVSKILGHSSVGVTEKIYAHAYDDDKRDAVSSVSRRLRKVGGSE